MHMHMRMHVHMHMHMHTTNRHRHFTDADEAEELDERRRQLTEAEAALQVTVLLRACVDMCVPVGCCVQGRCCVTAGAKRRRCGPPRTGRSHQHPLRAVTCAALRCAALLCCRSLNPSGCRGWHACGRAHPLAGGDRRRHRARHQQGVCCGVCVCVAVSVCCVTSLGACV
jgi:hypothetical protein